MDVVLEHEGWLYKRGAGFKKSNTEANNKPTKNLNASSSRLANPSVPSAPTSSFKAIPIRGKEEKLRFFQLKRTVGTPLIQENACLYYFSSAPSKLKSTKETGKITLTPKDSVTLSEDSQIELYSDLNNRTYYLRPNIDDVTKNVDIWTVSTRWKHALENSIKKLKSYESEYGPISLSSQRGMSRMRSAGGFMSFAKSSFKAPNSSALFEEKNEDDVESMSSGSLNQPNQTKYEFKDIWLKAGLDGYEKLISMFGAEETDSSRLSKFLEDRIFVFQQRLEIVQEQRKSASEPVIKHQATTFDALKQLYEQDKKNEEFLKAIKKRLIKVKMEYDSNVKLIHDKTYKVIESRKGGVEDIKQKKLAVLKAKERIQELAFHMTKIHDTKSIGSMRSSSKRPIGRRKSITSQIVSRTAKGFNGMLGKLKERLQQSKEIPSDDPEELEKELELAQETKAQLERTYQQTLDAATPIMIQTLNELQKFEYMRIINMQKAMKMLTDIEKGYYIFCASHCVVLDQQSNLVPSPLMRAIEGIQPDEDMKSTTQSLLSAAERAKQEDRLARNARV